MKNIKQTILIILTTLMMVFPNPCRAELYIVGSAIATSWNRQPMSEESTGVYTWEGYLFYGGELKFMTSESGWGQHWGPYTAGSSLGMGTQRISLHSTGDYKFRVEDIGLCKVQVNTRTRELKITDTEGNLPQTRRYPYCLYPVGSAIISTSDTNDYTLQEDNSDSGTYSGTLTLAEGTLSLHEKPYDKTSHTRAISPIYAIGASTKMPKMRYSIETDRCSYAPGENVTFTIHATPPSGSRIRYRHLGDIIADVPYTSRTWTWQTPPEDYKGYMVELYRPSEDVENVDEIFATIGVDVSSDWKRFPRYGFVANFDWSKTQSNVMTEMKWLNRCHINGVQFQDWHYCHDWPLGGTREEGLWNSYKDIANRTIATSSVKNYIEAQDVFGMKSIFYNLCFGVLDGWEERGVKPEWFIFKDKNHTTKDTHNLPSSWKSNIYLVNPANEEWLAYLAERNDEVYSYLDFDGYQIDQLGSRGTVYDYYGENVDLTACYPTFINYMKNKHPEKRLIMNAVSQWGGRQIGESGKTDFFYTEVWGNHEGNSLTSGDGRFSNLKKIIDDNLNINPALRTVFAAYMNYLTDNKDFNTPGVVMADAVMFALGGSHLELGGDHMLCREYFPYSGMKWHEEIEDWMIRYYDFLTAYENLLRDKWKEKAGIKASSSNVNINSWEPEAGKVTILGREVNGRQVVHLLNFTHEASSSSVNSDYLLCWHDNKATRPWPKVFESLPLTLSGMWGLGNVRRIWIASPDYCGGAVQEITDYVYNSSAGTITLTLPSLQFWTMIVVEPESTTKDNTYYVPAANAELLVPDKASSMQESSSATEAWRLQLNKGTYKAFVNIPAGTLTLKQDNEDAIILPFKPNHNESYFTPTGLPATPHTRGVLIGRNHKIFR